MTDENRPDEGEMAAVTPNDIERIRVQLKPGSVPSAVHLYTLYVRLMEADRRPIAHRTSLGWALRRAGWVGKRVRRRVEGKPVETASWVVPGAPERDEDAARLRAVLVDLGEGIHPEDTIWAKYQELAKAGRWMWAPTRPAVMRQLTKYGFPYLGDKRRRCRFIDGLRAASL